MHTDLPFCVLCLSLGNLCLLGDTVTSS